MDALLSAVVSNFVGRLITFLIGKYRERGCTNTTDVAVRLQRALLRARLVVEEAEGRQITNRAMLQQFNQLRQQLCRAAYALEDFRWRANHTTRSRRSHTMVIGFGSPSRTRSAPSSDDCSGVLSAMVERLEAALSDMREFVVLLNGCPRFSRQPYSAYLFMESCMFGRQMEKEEIIGFLSKPSQDLDVLSIIGPVAVGKWTLVEHVCLDERVRERFTKIHRLRSDGLDDLHIHHEHHHRSLLDFTERSLTVIDMIDGDANAEESWRAFHSAVLRRHAHRGSKIILISRTEAHSSLGTMTPLRLRAPCREELWYFFRALAFGAADPDERPDLAHIAMALCKAISDFPTFNAANLIAASLRANLSVRSWRRVMKMYAEAMVLQLGTVDDGLDFDEVKAGQSWLSQSLNDTLSTPFLLYNRRRLNSQIEQPKVTLLELMSESAPIPAGETRFDVVVWQSRIPPYGSYIATCDLGTTRRGKRKRRHDPKPHVPYNTQLSILCPSSFGCVPGSGGLLVFFP